MSERRDTRKKSKRTNVVVAAGLLVVVTAFVLVVARVRESEEVKRDVAAARQFQGFPLYWVGERFEKWDLREVELPGPSSFGFANLIYGDCEVEDPDGLFGPEGGSCTPPLSIQISPLCLHLEVVARAPIWKRRTIRGAPLGSSDSAPVLFTRGAQVKVYSGQGSDRGLALRALQAIRSLNAIPPVISTSGAIPPPDRRVLEGSRPCRDSRPGAVVIDENRGTYRGVGIGASPDAVRRVLGNKPFAGRDERWSPENAGSFFEVGGPNVLTPPCRPTTPRPGGPSRLQLLRYPEVSFAFCDGRAFALMVIERHARTQAGLGVGDGLEDARTLYPGLRCGQAPSGDAGRYPFCVGRMRPRRSLWFGQDPIGSITVSTTRFGVDGER
ncbi:MAG: hypothetical protein H0T39_09380 [Actinobacteria bacterium]|nr:hypothetical protein [Actinomycetota bacterium]